MNFPVRSLTLGAASLLALSQGGCRNNQKVEPEVASVVKPAVAIERLSPEMADIVPADAALEQVATGFTWVEGPVWIQPGYLLFADIPSNSIRKLAPDGKVSVWLQPSGYAGREAYGGKEPGSNGMTLDNQSRLTVAGHGARNVVRFESMDPNGARTVLADSYQGKALNSPNDLVYGRDGSLYFTDPPYGLRTQADSDPHKELKINGVYRVPGATAQKAGSAPDRKKLELLVSDLPRPNGIALSPDNKWLYVGDSGVKKWMRYPVKSDGTVGPGALLLDASQDKRAGAPDGLKLDMKGNLYASGPGGVWIISPEGKHLGTILTEKRTANVAWGGDDGTVLYLTTTDSIYRIPLKVPGYRP